MKKEKFISIIRIPHINRAKLAFSRIGINIHDTDGKFKNTSTLLDELSKKYKEANREV